MNFGAQERQIRRWLGSTSEANRARFHTWLSDRPKGFCADLLARIAMEANPATTDLLHTLVSIAVLVFTLQFPFPFSLLFVFALSHLVQHLYRARRKRIAIRAALHLAEMQDFRAIGPLARCCEPQVWFRSRYQEDIEKALVHLLTRATCDPQTREFDVIDVQAMAMRLWRAGQWRRELADDHADLLLAAVRYLRTSESPVAFPFLWRLATPPEERVAHQPVAIIPNHRLVQEVTHLIVTQQN